MPALKADIIAQLEKEILPLQGFKPPRTKGLQIAMGSILQAFPNAAFPTGAVHEFLSATAEQAAATNGFVGGVLGQLMKTGGACIWISTVRKAFPAALQAYGIDAHRVIFIDCKKEKEALWVMEECLKCEGLAAVVGEIKDIDLTASRRLQLAVEKSRVTGFLLRHQARNHNAIACVARWQITPMTSTVDDAMPGVGFPQWNVALLKVRNGKPGSWQTAWVNGRLQIVPQKAAAVVNIPMRQTG